MIELYVFLGIAGVIIVAFAWWSVNEVTKERENMFNCDSEEEDWK